MSKTILQVPLDRDLRDSAEKMALTEGFSSLQEVVRVFLTKFARKKIEVTVHESAYLSAEAEKRYEKMRRDFAQKKNVYSAQNVNNLMKQLNADTLS